jgi:cell division protein FtsI (penicillin-binding protein 3)
MKVREKNWIRFRICLVGTFFLAGLGIILGRAFQLQILDSDKLAAMARVGYRESIKLPPKRGTIYDREGHELAVSIEVGSIYAHPSQVPNKSETAGQLSKILSVKKGEIIEELSKERSFVWIARKVPSDKVNQIKALKLAGIGFTKESGRYYPGREIGAHLIGFSGEDNQGLEGLEKKYDRILKGREQTLIQMRDALGRPFFVSQEAPEGDQMHDLILTIDKDIQYKAQEALKMAVERTKAKSGQAVVVDPETGEILAMAVVPLFNPNTFRKHRPSQWRNRIITDVYEPGSVIKVFLLATALDQKILTLNTKFFCEEGQFKVANHIIHDTKKNDFLSVSDIVVYSSNIGAVKIGQRVGYERFTEYLKKFGFGKKTGIGLLGERTGFIRPVRLAKEIDKANIYFGQGMTASSLQLTMAMAAIANGGKLMRPFVIKSVKDQQGVVVTENRPKMIRQVISPEVASKVRHVLERVVDEGTGTEAAISGFRAAGKTGTSQKVDPRTMRYSQENYMSLFVGFVPVDKPRLVIMVAVDEPREERYGGLVAGPVFKELGGWTLNHLRVNPQVRLVKIEEDPKISEVRRQIMEPKPSVMIQDPDLLPDFRGQSMREVLRGGRSLGLDVVLEGTGLAVRQVPQPGSPLKKVTKVEVQFQPPM